MRSYVVLPVLATAAAAQNASYFAALTAGLQQGGNAGLAKILGSLSSTNEGQTLFKIIPETAPVTLFAPDDNALSAVPADVASNTNLLANIISYHLAPGNYSNATATSPNVTVAHTLLNDTALVNLEGKKSQVLIFNQDAQHTVNIQNQPTNVTVSKVYFINNVEVKVINAVLTVPGNLTTVLGASGLSSLGTVASSIPGVVESIATAKGYTLFAPTNDAFTAAASTLASLQGNNQAVTNVLGNHIINGTTVYSANIEPGKSTFTSAAGQKISFVANSTGLFVVSGDNVSSAQIVKTNILVDRGVIHEISSVLANTNSDSNAAASAYSSATSIAAQPTQTNAGAGGQGSGSPGSSGGSSGSGNGAGSIFVTKGGLAASVVGVLGALMGGFFVL